jgi:hypothetical protein
MPALTPANGAQADRFQAVGRTVYQYEIAAVGMNTTPYAVGSNFQKIIRAMQQYGTIEMIGQQGLDAAGQASVTKCTVFMSGNEDTVHPVDADLTAAKTGAANNVTLVKIAEYNYQGSLA